MRKTVAALALSAAAAGSLMLAGSAQAATKAHPATVRPADADDLPGYSCLFRGPAPTIFPPMINGRLCVAVNGAPETGFVFGPVAISTRDDGMTWICRDANANDYPASVIGRDCYPAEVGGV